MMSIDLSERPMTAVEQELMAQKGELLHRLRETLQRGGYDGRNANDNILLLNALCDLIAMSIAAWANDVEATTQQIGSEVLPAMVAWFQENPSGNFWLRKKPN